MARMPALIGLAMCVMATCAYFGSAYATLYFLSRDGTLARFVDERLSSRPDAFGNAWDDPEMLAAVVLPSRKGLASPRQIAFDSFGKMTVTYPGAQLVFTMRYDAWKIVDIRLLGRPPSRSAQPQTLAGDVEVRDRVARHYACTALEGFDQRADYILLAALGWQRAQYLEAIDNVEIAELAGQFRRRKKTELAGNSLANACQELLLQSASRAIGGAQAQEKHHAWLAAEAASRACMQRFPELAEGLRAARDVLHERHAETMQHVVAIRTVELLVALHAWTDESRDHERCTGLLAALEYQIDQART